jgi:hypothetical protein
MAMRLTLKRIAVIGAIGATTALGGMSAGWAGTFDNDGSDRSLSEQLADLDCGNRSSGIDDERNEADEEVCEAIEDCEARERDSNPANARDEGNEAKEELIAFACGES